jgi:hypothetical protein
VDIYEGRRKGRCPTQSIDVNANAIHSNKVQSGVISRAQGGQWGSRDGGLGLELGPERARVTSRH